MTDIDVMRSHASFVEARCEDGATVARDMRAMAAEVAELREEVARLQAIVDEHSKIWWTSSGTATAVKKVPAIGNQT